MPRERITSRNFVIDAAMFDIGDTVIRLYDETGRPFRHKRVYNRSESKYSYEMYVYYVIKEVSDEYQTSRDGRKKYKILTLENRDGVTKLPSFCVKKQKPPTLAENICYLLTNVDPQCMSALCKMRYDYNTGSCVADAVSLDEYEAAIAHGGSTDNYEHLPLPENIQTEEEKVIWQFIADAFKSGDSGRIAVANVMRLLMTIIGKTNENVSSIWSHNFYGVGNYSLQKLLELQFHPSFEFKPRTRRW